MNSKYFGPEINRVTDPWWAVVNTVMKVWVSHNEGNFLDICGTIRIWRRTLLYWHD